MAVEQSLRLVADVGGTQLRIGLARPAGHGASLHDVEVVSSHAVAGVAEALQVYWQGHGRPALAAVAVCVAGPVDGIGLDAHARLTNVALEVSARSLSQAFGAVAAGVVNDFAAVAAATPAFGGDDLELHEPGVALPRDAITVVLGPGTGLGVAAWLPGGVVVAGEGGHAHLAAPGQQAMPAWAQLIARQGYVTAEQILCGRGLVTLYRALAAVQGAAAPCEDAAAVWQANLDGEALAQQAVEQFTNALGAYAGDLALIFGAQAVLLAGGILPRWGSGFDHRRFRQAFGFREPEFQARLARVPSATILHPYPGLLGLGCMPIGR